MNRIPDEIFINISSYIDYCDVLNLSHICSKLRFLNHSWKTIFHETFPELIKHVLCKKDREFKQYYKGFRNEITVIMELYENKHKQLTCYPIVTGMICRCREICKFDYVNAFLFLSEKFLCSCSATGIFFFYMLKHAPPRIFQEVIKNNNLVTTITSYKDLQFIYKTKNNKRLLNYLRQIKSFQFTVKYPVPGWEIDNNGPHFLDFVSGFFLGDTNNKNIEDAVLTGYVNYRFLERLGVQGYERAYDRFPCGCSKLLRKMINQLHLYPSQHQAVNILHRDDEYAGVLFSLPYIRNNFEFIKVMFSFDLGFYYTQFNYHPELTRVTIINKACASFMQLLKHFSFYYDDTIIDTLPMVDTQELAVLFLQHLIKCKNKYMSIGKDNSFCHMEFIELSMRNGYSLLVSLFLCEFYYSDELFAEFAKEADLRDLKKVMSTCSVKNINWYKLTEYYLRNWKLSHLKYTIKQIEPSNDIIKLLIRYDEPDLIKIAILKKNNTDVVELIDYTKKIDNKKIQIILDNC